MKMARILIAIILIAMMANLVACDKKSNNGTKNEDVVPPPLDEDIEYTPNEEDLIGLAVYPVVDGQYPYNEGDIIEGHHNCFIAGWKMVYSQCLDDGYLSWCSFDFLQKNGPTNTRVTTYITDDVLVWGYVYQNGEDIFIVATRDIVNYDEDNMVLRDVTVAKEGAHPYTNFFIIKHALDEGINVEDLVDTEYVPKREGLVGIAVYPIDNSYPYQEGDIIPASDEWEYSCSIEVGDGFLNKGSANLEEEHINNVKRVTYAASTNSLCWGYVYLIDEKLYIVATHDLVDFDNGVAMKSVDINLTSKFPTNSIEFIVKH